jgi:hypothetical protein
VEAVRITYVRFISVSNRIGRFRRAKIDVRWVLLIFEGLLVLIGAWVAFFVTVMSCFASLLWLHRRLRGGPGQQRRRREY